MTDYDPACPSVRCPDCVDGGNPSSPHSSPPDPCRTCGGWQRVPFVARTDDFLATLRELTARQREQDAHRSRAVREVVVPAYEAAVRAARPRAPAFGCPDAVKGSEAVYLGVREWARAYLKPTAFDAVERPLVEPFTAEQERIAGYVRAARKDVARLAPWAVFRATSERIEVYRPYPGAYASQGFGEDSYLRADCAIRVALLRARGFDAKTVLVERAEFSGEPVTIPAGTLKAGDPLSLRATRRIRRDYTVVANVPPEAREALPFWRLDDQRLLDTTHPANLKVLFGSMFPHAGGWDWPEAARERRHHASFRPHRANEDAHLNLNRRPPC